MAADFDGALGKKAGACVMQQTTANRLALSLILCSRNDEYMGNSRWRLETTLNYVAHQVEGLGRGKEIEVLVADWGSEIPLREVLRLTPAAAQIVSFILIPPEIARRLQKDSPFPEVLALNAAARRARGSYIGRIDQDTLVGQRFLEIFFALYESRRKCEVPLERALLFSNVRMVPYRFAVRCPSIWDVEQFVERFGGKLKIEIASHLPFYHYSVGIWLLPTALWNECGGYDENMLYMNGMEIDMIQRLLQKYVIVDLGKMIGYDCFHLEHYHPWVPRRSSVYRKTNDAPTLKAAFQPNGESWGLVQWSLSVDPYASREGVGTMTRDKWRARDQVAFSMLLLLTRIQIACDILPGWCSKLLILQLAVWRHRTALVRDTIWGKPIGRWHSLLHDLWVAKRVARREASRRE
jgi:hypothetical protein